MIPTPFAAAQARRHRERLIDEALAESFPASDPPAWTLGPDLEGEPEAALEAEPPKTSQTEDAVTSSADPSRTTPRRRRRRSRRG